MAMTRFERLARRLVLVLGLGVGACGGGGGAPGGAASMPVAAAPAPEAPAPEAPAPPAPETPAPATPAPETPAPETPAPEPPAPPAPSAEPPAPEPPPPAPELAAQAQDDLARLRALDVVEVRALHLPDQKTYCYGNPCPDGAAWQQVLHDAYERQVPRLSRLRQLAEATAADPDVAPADPKAVDVDLSSLDALDIVDLGALLTVAPADNPRCYNLPCAEDVAAAKARNAWKAGVVHELLARVKAARL